MVASLKKVREFIVDETSDARLSVTVSDMVDLFMKCADYYALSVDISESPIAWAEAETRYAQAVDKICLGKSSDSTVQAGVRGRQVAQCLQLALVIITQLIILFISYAIELTNTWAIYNARAQSLVVEGGALSGVLPLNMQTLIAQATNTTVPIGQTATIMQQFTGYVPMEAAPAALQYMGISQLPGRPVPGLLLTWNEDLLRWIQYVLADVFGGGMSGVLLFVIVNRLLMGIWNSSASMKRILEKYTKWWNEQNANARDLVDAAIKSNRPPEPVDENDVAGLERMAAYYTERARVARNASALVPRQPDWLTEALAQRRARRARSSQNDDNDDSDDDKDDKPPRKSATRSE